MSLARVLIIGADARLLESQATVLRHFWHTGTAESSWSELALARAVSGSNVVVLCATLETEQRRQWVAAIRESSPEKIVVQLNSEDTGPRGGLDATVALNHGPAALVSTIYGLLVERGLGSKGWKPLGSTLLDDIEPVGPIQ